MPFQIRLILTTEVILIRHDLPDRLGTQAIVNPRSSSSTLTELPFYSCSAARDGKNISRHATESRINVLILDPPIQCRLNITLKPRFEKYGRCFDIDIEIILRRSLRLNTLNELLEVSILRNRLILPLVADGCRRRGGLIFVKAMIFDHITIATLGLTCSCDAGVVLLFPCVLLKQCQFHKGIENTGVGINERI
jgi:hypothetical protein